MGSAKGGGVTNGGLWKRSFTDGGIRPPPTPSAFSPLPEGGPLCSYSKDLEERPKELGTVLPELSY